MQRNSITAALVLFLFTVCKSQDFRPGYIITLDHDTIQGLIDYKGDINNGISCSFKSSESSEKIEYTPEELFGYRFENSKFYLSKEVNISGQPESYFLEFLVNGIIDIYFHRNLNTKEYYYFDSGDESLIELIQEEKIVVRGDQTYKQKHEPFRGVLQFYLQSSPTSVKKISNIELGHQPLIKLAKDYHEEVCLDEACIVYEKDRITSTWKIGVLGGYSRYSISPRDVEYRLLALGDRDAQYTATSNFTVGFFISKNLPFLNERLSLSYEFVVQPLTIRFDEERPDRAISTAISKINLNHPYLFINHQLSVSFRFRGSGLVLKAGAILRSGKTDIFFINETVTDRRGVEIYNRDSPYSIFGPDFGPFGGIAYSFGIVDLELLYGRSGNMVIGTSSNIEQISLIAVIPIFRFNK